ncbi:MAG: SusD/RagB family nutrient-binding outer membrane lipoprotein, partial [Sphingobacteriales bacterium]
MKYINKFLLGFAAVGVLAGTGCKKFKDVNTDPNNAADVTVELLLSSAEADIAQVYGSKFQVIGGIWGQYWTQSPNASQYRELEQYQIGSAFAANAWSELYSVGLKDMDQIIKKAGSKKNYAAIAMILKGYTYQLLTDQFGDIPFSEALKGDQGISSPKYDSQESVYEGMIAMVKEGRDALDPNSAIPGNDDLIYHGDLDLWQRFANTLLLRMYMRLSEKSPAVAQAGIAALEEGAIGFLNEGESAEVHYYNEAGNFNPLFSEMNNATITKIQNLIASKTTIDSLNANNDYRLFAFYTPTATGFVALDQGFYNIQPAAASYATPSPYVGGRADNDLSAVAPVRLFSDYESLFLQAEAVVRGWMTGDDQALFERGIAANYTAYSGAFNALIGDGTLPSILADSVATSDSTGVAQTIPFNVDYLINTYINGDAGQFGSGNYYLEGEQVAVTPASYWGTYPAAGTAQEKIRHIITQKWFSMCGNQGIEAW